jgi:glycine/D-amino acid oxidase-like deaminating enzyme/nitrite reductase/ring-hydroxylating ferredoxin subunit
MTPKTSTTPLWDDVRFEKYPPLAESVECDVAVIGGGITGLTAAYLLGRAGKSVCLLERGRLGGGDTGSTTAHLTCVTDLRLSEMAELFGKATTRAVWDGGAAAIDTIERIVESEGIDCGFRRVPGFLHAALDGAAADRDRERERLEADCAQARDLGVAADFLDRVPLLARPGMRVPNQAKIHPLRYIAGLARAIGAGGCSIFEDSEVTEFTDSPHGVKANGRRIACDYVVIATHVPLMGKAGIVSATLFQTKLAPYSSYVVGARIPQDVSAEACYWDTADPYHYLRIDETDAGAYAIFGGEDHKTGQDPEPEERFEALARRLLEILPQAKVDRRWSGQVIETHDGLPYIGETAERQFVATGFAGNGMTFGTLAATMACDAVLGRKNAWQEVFAVERKKLRGATWDYVTENLDYPYYLVRDRLKGPEARSPREVRRGEGKVLVIDGRRVACSRDDGGKLAMVSAVCTHMGCLVRWNPAEKTWDCPCHGSRFRPTGEVLAGPAETPLEPFEGSRREARGA